MKRIIFHIDQNCYFASVEMLYHPECRDVPMAVVGDPEARHGIILAKNEHAKKYGVSTAEAIWQAKLKCPGLVTLPAHHDKYEFYSQKLRDMYAEYTDRVEPFGLDECWLDMSGLVKDYGEARELADSIRERVKTEFGLTCSVGVSFNKIFAKLGSDYRKPDATTVFDDEGWRDIVWELPVSDLLFVGRNTAAKLRKININSIGDLAACDRTYIEEYLGVAGRQLWEYANGLDDSEVSDVFCRRDIKSVGNSVTTPADMTSDADIAATLHTLSESVAQRLRKHKLKGDVIQITVRDRELHIYEHQKIADSPTNSSAVIYRYAKELFDESCDMKTGIRSLGVRCARVVPESAGVQLSFFDDVKADYKADKIGKLMDEINGRFGEGSIRSAASGSGERKISEDPFHPEGSEF